MNQTLNKIEASFKAAMRGEETIHNLIWYWGAIAYVTSYLINRLAIGGGHYRFFDITISVLICVYFVWHIYVLKKCSPKKPKLTKEEKRNLRILARKDFGKRFIRKLFLQEPLSEWNPVFVTVVIDVFSIANFINYIF